MKTYIMTANQSPNIRKHGGYRKWIAYGCKTMWGNGYNPNWKTQGEILHPEIRQSKWTIGCPYCLSSYLCEPGEPMFCYECMMQSNTGHARPTSMPSDRKQIETILCYRPVPANRNWLYSETLADLIAENILHNVRTR